MAAVGTEKEKHVFLSNCGAASFDALCAFPLSPIHGFNDDVFLTGHLTAFSQHASVSALCNSCVGSKTWAFDVAIFMNYSSRVVIFSGIARCFHKYTASRTFFVCRQECVWNDKRVYYRRLYCIYGGFFLLVCVFLPSLVHHTCARSLASAGDGR